MGDQRTPDQLSQLAHRMPRIPPGPAVPLAVRPVATLDEQTAALVLAGHVAQGDLGAVRRTVNRLEHGLGPWAASPWRLVEQLADLLIRRAEPPGAVS